MRRQSKPFVTEYRSSGRRGKGGSGLENGGDSRNSEAEGQRVSWPPAKDDGGFDAVLAAADALFAGPSANASDRATASAQGGASGEPGRGRILQAIEQSAPSASKVSDADRSELAASDAPKRRGRKPGSKRTAPSSTTSEVIEPLFAIVGSSEADEVGGEDLPTSASLAASDLHDGSEQLVPTSPVLAASSAWQRRRGERFSWVRTKLRPGERWKRRLPKVAW